MYCIKQLSLMDDVNRFVPLGGNECQYYSKNSEINIITEKLNVIHINIRTVNSNLDELLGCLKAIIQDFHINVLTETSLKSEDNLINVPGFNAFHLIRARKIGGGCTIMTDSFRECSLLQNLRV